MGAFALMLWIAGAVIVTAPFAIWHYGMVGLRFGFFGLGLFAVATVWRAAEDGAAGLAMFVAWLAAFSYVGVFALIAHAADHLFYRSGQ